MDNQPSIESPVVRKINKSKFLLQHENLTVEEHNRFLEEASTVIIYSAAAVGSSTALLFVTNLETITLFIFIVSFLYGMRTGFLMMLTTSFSFELFASLVYGFSGLTFAFKVLSYALIVLFASVLHPYAQSIQESGKIQNRMNRIAVGLSFSVLGLIFTLVFDLVTAIPSYLILQNFEAFVLFFITGIPFFIFHQFTNVILFFFVPNYLNLIHSVEMVNHV